MFPKRGDDPRVRAPGSKYILAQPGVEKRTRQGAVENGSSGRRADRSLSACADGCTSIVVWCMGPNGASVVRAETPTLRVRFGANAALKLTIRLATKTLHRFSSVLVVAKKLRAPAYLR